MLRRRSARCRRSAQVHTSRSAIGDHVGAPRCGNPLQVT